MSSWLKIPIFAHYLCKNWDLFLLQFLLWFQGGHKSTSKVKYLGAIIYFLSRGKLVKSFKIKRCDTRKREGKVCALSPFSSLYCMTTWNLMSRAITGYFQHRGRADWSSLPRLQLVVLVGLQGVELYTEAVNWEWKSLQGGKHLYRA